MAYLIPKKALTQWIGEETKQNLPCYLVLSHSTEDSYRLEPLAVWLSRHGKRKVIPKLSPSGLSDTG